MSRSSQAKPFQDRTIAHVIDRLSIAGRRFLVADEAGLGKTIIARDVVQGLAKRNKGRLLVLYVCSNADIAKQNKERLTDGLDTGSNRLASRLTLLPLERDKDIAGNGLALICLTAGTSLDFRSGRGKRQEREFIHALLTLLKFKRSRSRAAARLFAPTTRRTPTEWLGGVKASLRKTRGAMDSWGLKEALLREWRRAVPGQANRNIQDELADLIHYAEKHENIDRWGVEHRRRVSTLIGHLRQGLARAVVECLEPDLIIMDEFQNFADLLMGKKEGQDLAERLLDRKKGSRLLLLSATPYKAFTSDFSLEDEKHSRQLEAVVGFLADDPDCVKRLRIHFKDYHNALVAGALKGKPLWVSAALKEKESIQDLLTSVMARTERHGAGGEELSLVEERAQEPWVEHNGASLAEPLPGLDPEVGDLRCLKWLDKAASPGFRSFAPTVAQSIPFPLNFMSPDSYKFIKTIQRTNGKRSAVVCPDAAAERESFLLGMRDLRKSDVITTAANAKLRAFMTMLRQGQWGGHLWIPPAKPYYKSLEDASSAAAPKKFLVFSRWKAVPQALSILASQDAERIWGTGERRPFRFIYPQSEGQGHSRMTHKSTLLLFHPSLALARIFDPLEEGLGIMSQENLHIAVISRLKRRLKKARIHIRNRRGRNPSQLLSAVWRLESDEFRALYSEATAKRKDFLPIIGRGVESSQGIVRYVQGAFRDQPHGNEHLYISKDELGDLANLCIGGPGVGMLRALLRFGAFKSGGDPTSEEDRRLYGRVLQVCHGRLRRFFSAEPVSAAIRATATSTDKDSEAWRLVLAYCVSRHWQAMLDEYCGCLKDDAPLKQNGTKVEALLDHMEASLRVPIGRPQYQIFREGQAETKRAVHRHIAQAFADDKVSGKEQGKGSRDKIGPEVEGDLLRDQVRRSFNSPFWPFVLATTSVGQEGLDFHRYCADIVHWNLPARAPSFEQREGRLQRYLSLAVREAIAKDITDWRKVIDGGGRVQSNPWTILVEKAAAKLNDDMDGMAPYWIYRNGANISKIRRWVLAHPFSREAVEYRRLKESVLMYRLVLGAPQQEDAIKALRRTIPTEKLGDETELRRLLSKFWIDLRPRS